MSVFFSFNKIWVVIYLLIVLGLALEGNTRKIGWFWSAFFGLILTPVIGFFITIFSPKRTSPNPKAGMDVTYTCQHCGFGYTERKEVCSICGESFSPKNGKIKKKDEAQKATSA